MWNPTSFSCLKEKLGLEEARGLEKPGNEGGHEKGAVTSSFFVFTVDFFWNPDEKP